MTIYIQIQHQLHTAVPLNETDHWLVEIAYPNCHQDQVTMASQRLFALASQLAGLVVLKVLDHTFLQTKLKYSD
ncbi:hypothetical protein HDV02_000137 [Globomyces sp. JEL0801]|nr:hypothetical protein HDV02_000137 [Globomyces sp. JEL0801]